MSIARTLPATFDARHLRAVPAVAPASPRPRDLPALASPPAHVPVLGGRTVPYAALDHAASTSSLATVESALALASQTYSSVHRGTGWLSTVTSRHYEAARAEVARFVGAREDDHVVFTRNTTDATNLLARALPKGTRVLTFASDHHATLLPWPTARTHRLPVPGSPRDAELLLAEALSELAADDNDTFPGRVAHPPVLVALTAASNVTGEYWPISELARIAHAHGARVFVDAAQLAAHERIDLTELGADHLAFSGHKVHAPHGAGVLVGRADWLDAAQPYLAGGGASAEVSERHTRWSVGPARHEAGSPHVLGAIALAAACATLHRHREALRAHETALTATLLTGLRGIEGVRVHELFGADSDRAPVATFTVDGLDSHLVAAALSAEHGIGVRAGKFCAHVLVDTLLAEGGTGHTTAVRASAGLATSIDDVIRLLRAVAELAATGPRADYRLDPVSGWQPVDDDRVAEVTPLW